MLSIRCFCGVGLFCRTKCSPALSATFRKRIGLNDVARFVFSGGKNKNPRPAARNSLRVLLLMRFTRHLFNDLAIPETKASIFQIASCNVTGREAVEPRMYSSKREQPLLKPARNIDDWIAHRIRTNKLHQELPLLRRGFHLSQVLIDFCNQGNLAARGGKLPCLFKILDRLYLVACAPVGGAESIEVGRCFVIFRNQRLSELCDCALVLLLIHKNAT